MGGEEAVGGGILSLSLHLLTQVWLEIQAPYNNC